MQGWFDPLRDDQRQELAINEANKALARSNADLQQFAYSASHDLQEPLRMVTTYSELLQKGIRRTTRAERR